VRALSPVEVAVLGKENFLNMMRLMPATEEEILNTVQTRVMRDRQRNQDSPS
jgi:CRP-like cAMP-binding protein